MTSPIKVNVPIFLASPDVEQLTGLKRFKAQARWLARHGYKFDMNALGRPVVLMSAVREKLNPSVSSSRQPNFEALYDG